MITFRSRSVYKNLTSFWVWFIVAQLSFLTTLWLPYQGEEAVYAIASMEMSLQKEWIIPTVYRMSYERPPLLNWILIPFGEYFGWDDILVISRTVAATATLLTSLLLMGVTYRIFRRREVSLFAGLIYMSGDVLFRRGWLAYADPLFSLFVFGALAALWLAVTEKKDRFLFLAAISLMASFLTKALTGYVFYFIALLVFARRREYRKFLFNPPSIFLHAFAIALPIVWSVWISQGAHGDRMIYDIFARLNLNDLVGYCIKITLFPLDTFMRWLPVSGLIVYFWVKTKQKGSFLNAFKNPKILDIFWIVILNYLPYWIVPESHVRYLLPLSALLAWLFAYWIFELGTEKVKIVMVWLVIGIMLRYAVGIFWFPYYEKKYRGDYQAVAHDILNRVGNRPLYTDDYFSVGLNVAVMIDIEKMPNAVIRRSIANWEGYLMSSTKDIPDTVVAKTYRLGNQSLYLLCRGQC
jgi:4-amino-4-deoxy-L-arabinose transferase-like glycosyltransferase